MLCRANCSAGMNADFERRSAPRKTDLLRVFDALFVASRDVSKLRNQWESEKVRWIVEAGTTNGAEYMGVGRRQDGSLLSVSDEWYHGRILRLEAYFGWVRRPEPEKSHRTRAGVEE